MHHPQRTLIARPTSPHLGRLELRGLVLSHGPLSLSCRCGWAPPRRRSGAPRLTTHLQVLVVRFLSVEPPSCSPSLRSRRLHFSAALPAAGERMWLFDLLDANESKGRFSSGLVSSGSLICTRKNRAIRLSAATFANLVFEFASVNNNDSAVLYTALCCPMFPQA